MQKSKIEEDLLRALCYTLFWNYQGAVFVKTITDIGCTARGVIYAENETGI
jgi:hypothetical protein